MNPTLIADLLATVSDGKSIDIGGNKYWIEAYSEDEKLVIFVNGEEDSDDNYEYYANFEDAME